MQELVGAPKREDPLAGLTPREREMFALMAEGRTDRGIREALWLSQKTVESHVRSIFRKLDLPAPPPTTGACTQSSRSCARPRCRSSSGSAQLGQRTVFTAPGRTQRD